MTSNHYRNAEPKTSKAIKIYSKYVKYEYKFPLLLTAPTARKIATKTKTTITEIIR
jgi:hypothetical protein